MRRAVERALGSLESNSVAETIGRAQGIVDQPERHDPGEVAQARAVIDATELHVASVRADMSRGASAEEALVAAPRLSRADAFRMMNRK